MRPVRPRPALQCTATVRPSPAPRNAAASSQNSRIIHSGGTWRSQHYSLTFHVIQCPHHNDSCSAAEPAHRCRAMVEHSDSAKITNAVGQEPTGSQHRSGALHQWALARCGSCPHKSGIKKRDDAAGIGNQETVGFYTC